MSHVIYRLYLGELAVEKVAVSQYWQERWLYHEWTALHDRNKYMLLRSWILMLYLGGGLLLLSFDAEGIMLGVVLFMVKIPSKYLRNVFPEPAIITIISTNTNSNS